MGLLMAEQKRAKKREYDHEYYKAHRAAIIAKRKARADRPEYMRQYKNNNRQHLREYQREYLKGYRQTDNGNQKMIEVSNKMREAHPEKHRARYELRNTR